ncbi:MAG: hypothetical protein QOG83_272, partial [Alphaproteobacteria bacterium]|nr:hypothetical protein [Alphaproteobacteria bacterium]
MADTSSNATTPQLADIPSIQSFQFEADPLGQIRKSVNLFRGDVNLPLELVNLKADHGLTASATAVYDGSACHHVDIWNLDAPTGILGLGWSLPTEQVIASRTGAASDQLTSYYLRAAGAASEMIHTGTDADGSLLFQLQAYQFWRIRYYEKQQRWEITKEDGTKSIYGGSTVPGTSDGNSVQWGVAFGNWMISSAQTLGQSQIPVAWNLRQVVSTHGHAITYTYDVVTQAVGSGGKSYTKACYLSSITESGGRSIVLSYGEKIFQPGQLCEYQDPHKQTPNNNPDGYQSCYATRFLDQIAVRAADGTPLTSVVFSYSFFNTASNSNPAYPFLYKRILTAIHLRNERLDPLPGMVFTYNQPGEVAPGRLKTVEYPQGATATYGYHTLNLPSMRQQRILNPFTGSTPGVPRVWHGPDYSVITWVDTVGNRLQVSTYSWSGSWVDWTPASIQNAKVDLSSLLVAATENYFAVFYRDIQTSQGMLLLYQRDPTAFGTWTETVLSKPMKSGTATSTFAVGDDFVVVANPLFTGGAFMGAWWDWTKRAWTQPLLPSLPLATTPQVAIAGFGNFYVACSYDASRQLGSFQLISVSGHAWTSRSWSNTMAVLQAGGGFPFEWSLLPSGAVATYLTSMSASTATGQMMTFQWDLNYNPISPSTPVTQALNTPVANGQLVVNILATQSVGAMVGNGALLTRYVGGGASTNWAAHALDSHISATSSYQFAYGPDAAVMVKSSGGASAAAFSGFNPNIPNAAGWSQNVTVPQASAATVGDGYATIGAAIYQRQTDGRWIQTGTLMAASGRNLDPASVQNRAPSYIAYQDAGGTNTLTYIALIRNGVVQPAITLAPDPQCVTVHGTVGAGTDLAGPLAFVTYPAGSSFDAAPYLTLYRVVERAVSGAVTDTPVTTINIGNGFDDQINPPLIQAYQYNTAGMTLDSTTGVAQYPMVSMYGGTDSPTGRSPYGRTDFYYSNGLSTAAQAFYPAGWIYNYARILNGTLLATIARDADGKVLSTDIDYYQIFYTVRGSQFLYGAYPRAVQRSMTRDGVQTISQSQYDQQSGLAILVTTRSYLGGAVERVYEQRTTYAYQVPEYASAMLGAWVLNSVAQVVVTNDAAPVSGKVTTFKNWTTDSDWRWAAERSYTWTGTGTASFDFGPHQPNANWTLDRTILARTASGRIAARADATGLVTSYQFDNADHFQVAAFTNANALAGEAAYLGFEPYEPTAGWTIGTGATVVSGDAHAGHYALSVPHGTTGLSRGFTAARGDMLLVAWVKTSRGFGKDGGTARWDFNIGGVSGSVAITDTAQAWAPIVARLALPRGKKSASVAISCVNAKQTASFMVDDVRVGPFVGGFAARTLDTDRRLVTARLDGPLATRKFLYDSYNSRIAALGPEAASASAQQLSFDVLSRETQAGDSFNPAQPNASTTIATSGASAYLDLAAGVPLAAQYVASPAASWSVTGDAVSYSGGAAGSLVAADATLTAPCAFRFTVASAAALKSALSIGLTSAGTSTASVSFDPDTASYTLAIGTRTLGTRKTPVLSLPSSAVTALDAGQVTPAIIAVFTARGWPLSATATVRTRTAKSSWTISDAASAKVYYVVAAGGGLDVSVLAREWTLTAGTRSLLFFADGILLFGVPTDAMLAGVPCLSAGDPLTFANLIVTRPPADRDHLQGRY